MGLLDDLHGNSWTGANSEASLSRPLTPIPSSGPNPPSVARTKSASGKIGNNIGSILAYNAAYLNK